jgi:hypothetical protein
VGKGKEKTKEMVWKQGEERTEDVGGTGEIAKGEKKREKKMLEEGNR